MVLIRIADARLLTGSARKQEVSRRPAGSKTGPAPAARRPAPAPPRLRGWRAGVLHRIFGQAVGVDHAVGNGQGGSVVAANQLVERSPSRARMAKASSDGADLLLPDSISVGLSSTPIPHGLPYAVSRAFVPHDYESKKRPLSILTVIRIRIIKTAAQISGPQPCPRNSPCTASF